MKKLTLIKLNPYAAWTRREIGDIYQLHRSVRNTFSGKVLYRVETSPTISILALAESGPNMGYLLEKDWLSKAESNPVTTVDYAITPPVGSILLIKGTGSSGWLNGTVLPCSI
jgi:hypothetical protein